MPDLPPQFQNEYPEKGDTFHQIAELVLTEHGQQLTADEIAEKVGIGREGTQQHLRTLEEDGWIDGTEKSKTYTWDTQKYNPAEFDGDEALRSVLNDTIALAKRASRSPTELFAVMAVVGLAAGMTLTVCSVLALVLPIGEVPPRTFAVIGGGLAIGSIFTIGLVDLRATVARWQRG
jgi:biotin operon repressor